MGRQRVHHHLPGATGSHPTTPGGNHRRRPGALKAITTTWPTPKIQRCLIHIRRDTVRDLTLHPRTIQGRALLGLSRKPLTITTTDQAAA